MLQRKRVMRTQFHAVSLMKPDGIIQEACSGAPSRVSITTIAAVLEERLTIFLVSFYYHLQHTQLSGTTRGIRLRSPLYLQRSISTPELILLCEIANSQPSPKLRAQLVAFRQHSLS
jgi:hypothetical protein